MITEPVEAWTFDPVAPSVYFAFRPKGVYKLTPIDLVAMEEEETDRRVVERTHEVYGKLPPFTLFQADPNCGRTLGQND